MTYLCHTLIFTCDFFKYEKCFLKFYVYGILSNHQTILFHNKGTEILTAHARHFIKLQLTFLSVFYLLRSKINFKKHLYVVILRWILVSVISSHTLFLQKFYASERVGFQPHMDILKCKQNILSLGLFHHLWKIRGKWWTCPSFFLIIKYMKILRCFN